MLVVITAFLVDGRFTTYFKYGFTISSFTLMATTKLLLGLFLFTLTGSFGMFDRYLLTKNGNLIPIDSVPLQPCRARLVTIALHELAVRELTGHNDGKRVEEYLSSVGLKKGEPWCAAFISWVFYKEGFAKPRSGWCPDLFPPSRLARSALPGDVLGIYFEEYKRIAHVGLVEKIEGKWCLSIEGNTSITGSRDGDGVYRRRRLLKTIAHISNWVKTGRRVP